MSWFEILLILLLLLFPLIEQVAQMRRRAQRPPPEAEPASGSEAEDVSFAEEIARRRRAPQPVVLAPPRAETDELPVGREHGGSVERASEGWRARERESEPELARWDEGRSAEAGALARELSTPEIVLPEVVRVEHAVVSLEPLTPPETRRHAARREERVRVPVLAVPPPRPLLRTPEELRRAVLLAEVLGPPRALRPPDEGAG